MLYIGKRTYQCDNFCQKLLTFFTLICLPITPLRAADAVRVVHVGETARNAYFVVNRGSADGFKVGTKVCVYDENPIEENITALLCEVIVKAKKSFSAVRVSSEQFSLVSADQIVAIEGTSPVFKKAKEVPTDADETALKEFSDGIRSDLDPNQFVRKAFIIGLPIAIIAPVQFQLPKFNSAQFTQKNASAWTSGDQVKMTYIGLYLAYEKPFSSNWIVRPEFIYQFFPSINSQTDFDPTNLKTSIASRALANLYQLRFAALKATKFSDHWNISYGPGFSWAYSQVKFSATAEKTTGTDDSYAQYQSILHAAAIDGLLKLNYQRPAWHLETGLNLGIPFLEFSKSFTGTSDTTTTASGNDTDSISQALAHKKSSFGFGLYFGAGFIF